MGVGTVEQAVQPASEFTVATEDGVQVGLGRGSARRPNTRPWASTPELSEYFVKVKWTDTREANKAFNEVGLFGNQKHGVPAHHAQVAPHGGAAQAGFLRRNSPEMRWVRPSLRQQGVVALLRA